MDGDIVRVLIVEDDPTSRDLYQLFLQADAEQRYQPIAVDTGAAAIEIRGREPPDCAIFDFQLPDTTGLDALREVEWGPGLRPTIDLSDKPR
jgi:DNA-binding response OmpR family regulator